MFFEGEAVASYIKGEKNTWLCRLSVQKAHNSKFGVLPKGFAGTTLDCPRRYVTFYKDKVEAKIVEDKVELDPKYKELNEGIIKRGIAEELSACWLQLGKGELNPFDQKLFTSGGKGCIICSIINFDEKIPKNLQNKKITGFPEYLNNNNKLRTKIKYSDYLKTPSYYRDYNLLSFYTIEFTEKKLKQNTIGEIDTSKQYYIIYSGAVPAVFGWDFFGPTEEYVRKKLGLETDFVLALLFLIKEDDLQDLNCGFLYN